MSSGVVYSDLESADDLEVDDDGVRLVVQDDSDTTTKAAAGSGSRRYDVSKTPSRLDKHLPSWCKPSRLTRNERICLVVGAVALVVIVVVFVTVAVVIRPSTKPSSGNNGTDPSGNNGTDPSGNNGTDPSGGGSGGVPWADVRLQSSIVPETYDISLMVDLDKFMVTGSVQIVCSVTDSINYIGIHAKAMNITRHTVLSGGKMVDHSEVLYPENEFFILNLTQPLEAGPVIVALEFDYTLGDYLAGFYRSSYADENGEKRYLATTQFEPTDARRAFPCFDEPGLKANFTMHMTHHSRYRAWFNMPPLSRSEEDTRGFVTTDFGTSVKMSTYLVAFIVSDFECVNDTISSISGNDLLIQVCSNPLVVENTVYALQVAKDVIMFYEREFDVAYPLPKQDLFAIPDFSAGAMENWGLITYRETALLYNQATNPATSKQRVAVVVAHELAHQWFGDLVTMAWWDGLWLNEGFASFMEYLGTNSAEPSFNMLEQFIADDLVLALDLDGLNESHPILQEVQNPDEINSLFDSISYSKGASIIRMLRGYVGDDAFRAGITSYLRQHQFANAETHELWEALQDQAPPGDATVTEMMDTWTKQMGYPIFTVNRSTNTLTQTRFFSVKPEDLDSIASSPYKYIWKAPFNYIHYTDSTSESVPTPLPLVTSKTTSVQWPSGGWVKANIDQVGFYRVNYDVDNWSAIMMYLRNNLATSVLTTKDRAGLLDDAFALSYAGFLDSTVALNLSTYLVHEREYAPWDVAISWLYRFGDLLSLTPHYGKYRDMVALLLGSVVNTVPTSSRNLSHLDTYLQSTVLKAAAHFGNVEVIENATELFRQWRMNNISVDPDLKSLVYDIGISQGGEEDWDFVWDKYTQSNDPYEKRLYLRAMGQASELWLLNRYLGYSVTKIRAQDTLSVIVYVSRNIQGRYLAWNFVRSKWPILREKFGGSSFFDRFIRYVTGSFATEFELQQLVDFFAVYPDAGSATRGFRQAIEVIRGNIAWLDRYENME